MDVLHERDAHQHVFVRRIAKSEPLLEKCLLKRELKVNNIELNKFRFAKLRLKDAGSFDKEPNCIWSKIT